MIFNVYKKKRRKNGKVVTDRNYRGRYRLDGDFTVTEVPLQTSDKQVAKKRLQDIVTEKERERAGLIAPKLERVSADKPLVDHLDEFVADLTARGRTQFYANLVKGRVIRLIKACKWQFPKSITADSFVGWRSMHNAAPKTLNEYLNAINVLLNWMVKQGRIADNPLRNVERVDIRGKQQLRRAFTDEELTRLVEVAEEFRLLYITAAYTGLRLGELQEVIWADVFLAETRPYLLARAVTTKNRKQAIVPIHHCLIDEFRKASSTSKENDYVFPQHRHPHRRFKRHIDKAGLQRFDAAGRKIDFHSLRYTFATKLARQGVSQRLAQELMRHSDPRLTANLYTDTTHLPTFDAVEAIGWHEHIKTDACPHIGPQNPDSNSQPSSQDDMKTDTVNDAETSDHKQDSQDLTQSVTGKKMEPAMGLEPATY